MTENTTKQYLEELAETAKGLSDYSNRVYGIGWHNLSSTPAISCYLADARDHRAVKIDGIEIDLFEPAQYTLKLNHIGRLGEIAESARTKLKELVNEEMSTKV